MRTKPTLLYSSVVRQSWIPLSSPGSITAVITSTIYSTHLFFYLSWQLSTNGTISFFTYLHYTKAVYIIINSSITPGSLLISMCMLLGEDVFYQPNVRDSQYDFWLLRWHPTFFPRFLQARIQRGAQGRTPIPFCTKFFKKSPKLAIKTRCAPSFFKTWIGPCSLWVPLLASLNKTAEPIREMFEANDNPYYVWDLIRFRS